MRAIHMQGQGGPEVLLWVDNAPEPVLQAGEVLLGVKAAGVNRLDVLQRMGLYPAPAHGSAELGLEVAGVVLAVAPGVEHLREGDEVCALLSGGGYAERVAVPEVLCLPKPARLSWAEAASLPEAAWTVWSMLRRSLNLAMGETVLVTGANSGIGVLATQWLDALGYTVFATARTPEKCRASERLGAARAFCSTQESVRDELLAATQGQGVGVILDMVGGNTLNESLLMLKQDGRLGLIAYLAGRRADIDLSLMLQKRLTVLGSTLRSRTLTEKAQIARGVRTEIWPLLEENLVRPVVHAVLPMAAAAQAHQGLMQGQHVGKWVLTLDDSAAFA